MIKEAIGLIGLVAFAALVVWITYAAIKGVEWLQHRKPTKEDK